MTPTAYSTDRYQFAPPSMGRFLRSVRFVAAAGPEPIISPGTVPVEHRVALVISIMNQHLARKLTLADLARRAEVSVGRLSHLFKNQIGMSPKQYLKYLRLLWTKQLLESTWLSVKQVAAQVGLGTGALIRQFSVAYGATPARYRRDFHAANQQASGVQQPAAGDESSRIGL